MVSGNGIRRTPRYPIHCARHTPALSSVRKIAHVSEARYLPSWGRLRLNGGRFRVGGSVLFRLEWDFRLSVHVAAGPFVRVVSFGQVVSIDAVYADRWVGRHIPHAARRRAAASLASDGVIVGTIEKLFR